jgi:16S rRNA (cytosine967-C5)-methyltransferase
LTRRTPEDLPRLATLQRAILEAAATRVRTGGRLVYAVCTVLREECEEVVDAFIAANPDFALAPFDAPGVACVAGATSLRLLPAVHGTDGYFLASFVRVTSQTA